MSTKLLPRKPSLTDYPIEVEGVGTFIIARRKMKDEIEIQRGIARILDGVDATNWLNNIGSWMSTIEVLTVKYPEGFDLEELDPTDEQTYINLSNIYAEIRTAEARFRGDNAKGSEEESTAS